MPPTVVRRKVILSGDDEYDAARRVWNARSRRCGLDAGHLMMLNFAAYLFAFFAAPAGARYKEG